MINAKNAMIQKKPGYFQVGVINDIKVFMHWSFLFGGLIAALLYRATGYEILYICIAFAALIVIHEAGHAAAARYFGAKVFAIELSGLGGFCRSEFPKTRGAALVFVSAGLIAEAIVLVAVLIYVEYNGWPRSAAGASIAFVFTAVNGIYLVSNLLPIKERRKSFGTDGYLLWALLIQLLRKRPYVFPDTSPTFSPRDTLLNLVGFVPHGFEVGVEIFNDNSTSMQFIIDSLMNHFALSREKAIEMMLEIHKTGGMLIPLETYEHAQKVSAAISAAAREKGFNLVCRPVKTQP